jgi:hypothetical protein
MNEGRLSTMANSIKRKILSKALVMLVRLLGKEDAVLNPNGSWGTAAVPFPIAS